MTPITNTKTNTKPFQIFLLALAMSTAAYGGASSGGSSDKIAKVGAKIAYTMEKTATPTKWDPDGSIVVKFKHCVQGQPGNEAMIEALYKSHVDAIKFSAETRADAKANNYEVSSPPVTTQSVSLIKACPVGANATCDKGNVTEHYYTDSQRVLAGFEKSCGYSGTDTWAKN